MKELVTIMQNGSWFQVAYMNDNRLESITVQGFNKAMDTAKRLGIKHTPGKGCAVSASINEQTVFSMLK